VIDVEMKSYFHPPVPDIFGSIGYFSEIYLVMSKTALLGLCESTCSMIFALVISSEFGHPNE
jgi:hypothetical protein